MKNFYPYTYILKAAKEMWQLNDSLDDQLNELLDYLNSQINQEIFLKCELILSELSDDVFYDALYGKNDVVLDNDDLNAFLTKIIFYKGYKRNG